ncbi:DUF6877 family protein [Sporosarcina aquimarina]|uniref:DUF6877 family protein n=1 Tax=Sporosarcina aquimarina TaxID=114975 RepID=UPI001C8D8CBA|nr:DUF6877 family protein [Sporosarcina aquimarina]MBY0220972.1 hypothetical protein [Sporosarcina aquimarina]
MSKISIYEINTMREQLPLEVLQDIHLHIDDWRANGGNHDDQYVWQQLRYRKI